MPDKAVSKENQTKNAAKDITPSYRTETHRPMPAKESSLVARLKSLSNKK
jgi:hypothetical protein